MSLQSELREVRPYLGVDEIQEVLDAVTLTFGDATVEDRGRVTVPTRSFLRDRASLRLGLDEEDTKTFVKRLQTAVERAGLATKSCALVLVASTSRLKITEVVWEANLAELSSAEPLVEFAAGERRPRALQAPFGDFTATVYVLLSEQLESRPLRPWRKGTWLAKVSFVVATGLAEIGFTPIPLDSEARERLDLPEGCIRFVKVTEPMDPSPPVESVQLYVDSDLLATMAAAPHTPGARAFQRQLFVDAINALVYETSTELARIGRAVELEDIEGSIVWNLLRRAAGAMPDGSPSRAERHAMESLLRLLADHPSQFMARVEDFIPDLRKSMRTSIGEARR